MEEKIDVADLSRVGLTPIYSRLDVKKHKIAVEFCYSLLEKIDGWETYWENAKRCVSRSPFYGYKIINQDLSEIEKIVLFWKVIATELENRPKEFLKVFPETDHKFSDGNLEKLWNYILHCRHWWNQPIANSRQIIDGETDFMNAIKNGEDW